MSNESREHRQAAAVVKTAEETAEEHELDYVFKKLQLSQENTKTSCNRKPSISKSIEKNIGEKISLRHKRKQKHLIREAKLVIDTHATYNIKKSSYRTKTARLETFSENKTCLPNSIETETCEEECLSTCSAQFLNQSYGRYNEDLNPEELASYFEQMLYLPKPMSLMAEMMYA